jgi:hypothetical protein
MMTMGKGREGGAAQKNALRVFDWKEITKSNKAKCDVRG